MNRYTRITLPVIFLIILIPATGFLLFLLSARIFEYRPEPIEETQMIQSDNTDLQAVIPIDSKLSIFDWNIGYGGLDAGSDFVLDGGTQSLPESLFQVEENIRGIADLVDAQKADFYFFQEVDLYSKRSYRMDQAEILSSLKLNHDSRFALNFKVFFIPYPLRHPIGRVKSGLLNLSRFKVSESRRHQLPGSYSWPTRLFMLRRCINVSKYETAIPGQSLYLANVHLSAYDDGGMRKEQLAYIREWMMALYTEGNYVVLGGDWNSLFPEVGFDDFAPYTTTVEDLYWIQRIPENWTPEKWRWGWDPEIPSCRTLEQPYAPDENFRTIIDGYLVSPNVRIERVRTLDENFTYSDHNPVKIDFKLKP